MTDDLFTFAEATKRRDDGMRRAVEHADDVTAEWSKRAIGLLIEYARWDDAGFLAEQVRLFAHDQGLPSPPDGRAWGAVFQRAAKAGHIVRLGYAPAKSSNLSPKVLWGRA